MIVNGSNSQGLNGEIQEWLEKLKDVRKSVNNEEVKDVLDKILNESSSGQDVVKGISIVLKTATISLSIDLNEGKKNY